MLSRVVNKIVVNTLSLIRLKFARVGYFIQLQLLGEVYETYILIYKCIRFTHIHEYLTKGGYFVFKFKACL